MENKKEMRGKLLPKKIKSFLPIFILALFFFFSNVHTPRAYGTTTAEALAGNTDLVDFGIINGFLQVVQSFVTIIPGLALALMSFVFDADTVQSILEGGENSPIYALWSFVRDFLNIFFVMILLFSAFATIFQIEKYNYKKIFVRLIIAAFLVNFSWPLARILIDLSNILLFDLLNILSHYIGFSGDLATDIIRMFHNGGFGNIVNPDAPDTNTTTRIANIISIFLIGISLFAMAFLLLIRFFFLVVLIIFSPIAFMGSAIPGGSKFSDMWWDNLLKYSFFAPVMMLFFYIALAFMDIMKSVRNNMEGETGAQFYNYSSTLTASIILSLIPPSLIWIGMGVAMKMGIAGADATMGRAKKLAKWGGNLPMRGAKGVWQATGVPGGAKQRWDKFSKKHFEEPRKKREAYFAGESKSYEESKMRADAEELKKKNLSPDDWKKMAKDGNAAAAHLVAEGEHMDKKTYQEFMSKNKNAGIANAIDSKVKKYRVDLVLENIHKRDGISIEDAAKKEMGNMTAEQLAKQQWHAMTKDPGQKVNDVVGNQMRASYASLSDKAKGEFQEKARAKDWEALTT